jgi:hypothetical protein
MPGWVLGEAQMKSWNEQEREKSQPASQDLHGFCTPSGVPQHRGEAYLRNQGW